jgi:hypothetical protein
MGVIYTERIITLIRKATFLPATVDAFMGELLLLIQAGAEII